MQCHKVESLHDYAYRGKYLEAQSLINAGVDIDSRGPNGETPLMVAGRRSHRKIFKLLIDSGANIHCCDNFGYSLLHHAQSVKMAKYLVSKGIAIDKKTSKGETPLMMAAQRASRKDFELLVKCGADIHCCDDTGETALHHASWSGSLEIMQCLMNKGADLNAMKSNGQTPLMLAALRTYRKVVELLINSGADIHCFDNNGWRVLHFSCVSCGSHRKVVELLVSYGIDIPFCGKDMSLRWVFSDKGSLEIVDYLVNKGIPLDEKNYHGKTPLHLAVEVDGIEIVGYLLKAGADCNLEDNNGKSPFNYLLEKKKRNVEIIKLFIEKGAYVKSSDYKKLSKSTLLKNVILKDVKLCTQAVINKFNNKDLHSLYKGVTSAQKLPGIDLMKIGNKSRIALGVEESVTHEIQSIGFCNVIKMAPLVLGILCVKSFLENSTPTFNQENPSKSRKGTKRL